MIRRLTGSYLRPYLKTLGIALLFMVISAGMTAAFAKLIEPVMDDVLVSRNESLIVPIGLLVLGVFIVNGVSTYIHEVLMNIIGQSIVADVQRDLFSRFMGLDLTFFQDNPSGQLVARMISDTTAMRSAVSESLTGIGKSFLTLIFLVALMFWQDWKLALFVFCIFPVVGLFVARLGRRLRKVSKGIQLEIAGLTDLLSQTFQGIRQVKAFGMEAFEKERSGQAIGRVVDLHIKGKKISTLSTPVNETLIGLALSAVIIYGGFQVVDGDLTVGSLMSFIAAFSLAYEPLKKLAKLNNNLQMGLGAAERVLDMLDQQAEIVNKSGAETLKTDKPEVIFDRVTFGYGLEGKNALKDVTFTAAAGKVTALVGPSGSGKTTAINMVPRFYDVREGHVYVGDKDVKDLTLESLRSHIALVSQDITIFDDTVTANIAYGRPGSTEEEIREAARAAAAEDFILRLPEGYETRLGEHGTKLSGGQRQRIAIARAMLRNAPVLLLDEATSALDTESERAIQASLEKLQEGRTTLVIAHRLSTVQKADLIVVLRDGQVVEKGRHDELLARDGLYARMYRMGLHEDQP